MDKLIQGVSFLAWISLVMWVLVTISSTRIGDIIELRDNSSEESKGSTSSKHSFTDHFTARRGIDVPHLSVLSVVSVSD